MDAEGNRSEGRVAPDQDLCSTSGSLCLDSKGLVLPGESGEREDRRKTTRADRRGRETHRRQHATKAAECRLTNNTRALAARADVERGTQTMQEYISVRCGCAEKIEASGDEMKRRCAVAS
jgi:hypothetical protein